MYNYHNMLVCFKSQGSSYTHPLTLKVHGYRLVLCAYKASQGRDNKILKNENQDSSAKKKVVFHAQVCKCLNFFTWKPYRIEILAPNLFTPK